MLDIKCKIHGLEYSLWISTIGTVSFWLLVRINHEREKKLSEARGRRTEVGGQRSEVGCQLSVVKTPGEGDTLQNTQLWTLRLARQTFWILTRTSP
jgi:hypothetical protein